MADIIPHNFNLSDFKRANDGMIATSTTAYNKYLGRQYSERTRDYSIEEIERIVSTSSLVEQQKLSRNYFNKDGIYKRLIIHYATLLKYAGLLIPNPSYGQSLSSPHNQKRYHNAMNFIERLNLPAFFTNCAQRALVDGCYYGVVAELNKNSFAVIDLPSGYCTTRFRDYYNNDIIEFNLSYFDSILDVEERKEVLSVYPDVISSEYRKYSNGKRASSWFSIPTDITICFPFFDGRPPFLPVIRAAVEYDDAVDIERERALDEIRKIIVQHIPALNDGRLLFEPDEAQEIHRGTVNMLKGNKNLSVMTTYATVDAITSKTSADTVSNNLERMAKHIYRTAGTSEELLDASGSSSLEVSIKNDIAFMSVLTYKFANFTTNLINGLFANTNIMFKYTILPISIHNEEKYADTTYKLATAGYSYLLPMIALGFTQRDISNIKDLENDVLGLRDKLLPLQLSYTQGSEEDEGGAPAKNPTEKSAKTIQNEVSLENNQQ